MTAVPSDNWNEATRLLREAQKIVVLTGAGISAESGIATFRDDRGLWQEFPPDRFATWNGLLETALLEPRKFAAFLTAVLEPIATARPNAAHTALAELEQLRPTTIITQNVDGLHQAAGSRDVREIHGSLLEIVRLNGSPVETLGRDDLLRVVEELRRAGEAGWAGFRVLRAIQPIFSVSLAGGRRPNVVLFGSQLAEPAWSQAQEDMRACDLLLTVGTSGTVEPAASLWSWGRQAGAKAITIDPHVRQGDVWLQGRAGDILPRLVQLLKAP